MAFVKGVSGNPTGRPKEKPFTDALRLAVKRVMGDRTALQVIADNLVEMAAVDKNLDAIKEVANRLEGKPVQPIAGDDEAPSLNSELTITVVSGRPHSSGSSET